MRREELTRLETAVRDANPYPSLDSVAESDEFARMDALVKLGMGAGSAATVQGTDSPETQQRPLLRRQASGRPGWAVAVVAFLTVIVIGSGVALLLSPLSGGESIVADQSATTTEVTAPTETTVTAPTETTPIPVTGEVPMSWRRVPDDGVFAGSTIYAVVAGGPGLVAGGAVIDTAQTNRFGTWGTFHAALWVSEDGEVWERIDDSMLFATDERGDGSHIRDIASGPLGFVAVGQYGYDAAIWVSPDGLSWSRVDDDDLGGDGLQGIFAVTAGGPGWVAVGDSDLDALVWVSSDGLDWTLIQDEDLLAGDMGNADAVDVTIGGPGLVAVGSVGMYQASGDTASQAAVWISEDGVDWQRLPDGTFAGDRAIYGVTGDPASGRIIAFGTQGIWYSSDGREWTETARTVPLEGPPQFSRVAWDGDRLVAASWSSSVLSVWVSLDGGLTWNRIEPDEETFAARDHANDVVLAGSRFIAVGEAASWPGEMRRGAVWIGEWTDR